MKFIVAGITCALIAGILHMGFIMFDYAFFDSDIGAFPTMSDTLNRSMSSEFQNKTYNTSLMLREFFGWGRVICIGLCAVMFGIEVYKRPQLTG